MTNKHFRFGHWNTPEPWEWLAAQKSYLIPTNSHWPLKVSRAGWHHGHWQTRGCLSEDLKGWPTALSLKRPTLDSWWVELLGLKLHFCWASQLHSAQTKDSQCFLGTTILGSSDVQECRSNNDTGSVQRWQCGLVVLSRGLVEKWGWGRGGGKLPSQYWYTSNKDTVTGNSPVVQGLGLSCSHCQGPGSIPGQETKILKAERCSRKNKTKQDTVKTLWHTGMWGSLMHIRTAAELQGYARVTSMTRSFSLCREQDKMLRAGDAHSFNSRNIDQLPTYSGEKGGLMESAGHTHTHTWNFLKLADGSHISWVPTSETWETWGE